MPLWFTVRKFELKIKGCKGLGQDGINITKYNLGYCEPNHSK